MSQHGHANRKPKPLNLDIYSALLGGRPRIERPASTPVSPPATTTAKAFLDAPLKEQVGRCAATAALMLADARLRLIDLVSTSTSGKRDRRPRRHVDVTLGPAAAERSRDRAA